MKWTEREIFIIYTIILLICFSLGGMFLSKNNIVEYEIICESGEVERFNTSDEYICGGYPNPLRKEIIEIYYFKLNDAIFKELSDNRKERDKTK